MVALIDHLKRTSRAGARRTDQSERTHTRAGLPTGKARSVEGPPRTPAALAQEAVRGS
jgi:hypothetical protein